MLNPDTLNRAGIDYAAGMARFMNDAELYEAVLAAFADETLLERAQADYDSGNRAALLRTVHEAKGSCGNAGLNTVYVEAAALVALLRTPAYTDDELALCYRRFADAYLAARAAITAALS